MPNSPARATPGRRPPASGWAGVGHAKDCSSGCDPESAKPVVPSGCSYPYQSFPPSAASPAVREWRAPPRIISDCVAPAIAVRYHKMQTRWVTRRGLLRGAVTGAGVALFEQALRQPGFAESTPTRRVIEMSEPSAYFAYVGSRTTRERNARGDGINVFRAVAQTGEWIHVQLFSGLAN